MISDEALDAAVDALVASKLGDHKGINGEEFVEAAQAALEAAAPYMLAGAWEEGYGAGWNDCLLDLQNGGAKMSRNPDRSQA